MTSNSVYLVFSLACLIFYFYGAYVTFNSINNGKNDCRMTFMFEHPNYVKINFEENEKFPKYNLYAYSEGHLTENARNLLFTGAPVLFIPGNSGSYKQSRSLASVALRKGIDNDWIQHLDYFAVDLNEEYSALLGGVLDDQTEFIEHCIKAILKLYQRLPHPPNQLVIVGHSIGGKIAQKLLSKPDTAQHINTVITLAAPMRPVVNWDHHIDAFYKSIEDYWLENRLIKQSTNNSCCGVKQRKSALNREEPRLLDDKLFITIGGGNKDLMVHSGLTDSKFSDLHVMSTEMSKVWLESDHLCIVWCLQLVLVVNRFLYSIIAPTKYKGTSLKGLSFLDDKEARLAKAEQHFLGLSAKKDDDKLRRMESPDDAEWIEDNRRIFTEKFKNGLNRTRVQMIRLVDNVLYHTVRVDALKHKTDEWIFGCEAVETTGKSRYCSRATPLSKSFISKVPSDIASRVSLQLNLQELKLQNPKWTHVLLRFTPSREPFQYTVDIHSPSDRQVKIPMPKWYSFTSIKIVDDTLMGASHYQFNVTGLEETHQALEFILTPRQCKKHRTVAKICIPWTEGFNRFHKFSDDDSMILWTPKSRPLNYNTSANPITVDFMLDPSCRYSIHVRQSLGQMLARIVQQYSHWLPSHLIAILLLSLKHQISLTPHGEKFKCGSFHKALATCTPFFIITVSRLFLKFVLMVKILPKPEVLPTSLTVSILIHGSSIALVACSTGALWLAITISGSIAHKTLLRLIRLPIPVISDTFVSIIEKFPVSVAALLVSLAFASCGGIALILACFVYFILLSKMYEDYLENFVFKTAKKIAMKLFGRVRRSKDGTDKAATADNSEDADVKTDEKSLVETTEIAKDEHTEEDKAQEEEINRMLDEAMQKQRAEKAKKDSELAAARVEYDNITEGLSDINFHLPMFFLLLMISILSAPSVVTWARNYHYSRTLSPDPMLIPATCVLISLGVIWQLHTPRNLQYYKLISKLLYVAAVVSVLYCQDAIFKLNYIISGIFIVIAIHQVLSPKEKDTAEQAPPDFLDNLKTNFDRVKTVKGFIAK